MDFELEIHKRNASVKDHIFKSFDDSENFSTVEKAMSIEDFNAKYPDESYHVFTGKSLEKFEEDFKVDAVEKGVDSLEITKSIQVQKDGIERVYVRNEKEEIVELFVKQK